MVAVTRKKSSGTPTERYRSHQLRPSMRSASTDQPTPTVAARGRDGSGRGQSAPKLRDSDVDLDMRCSALMLR
eukprot:3752302-Rhodomonas_salina.1